jgi:hypothetical protein
MGVGRRAPAYISADIGADARDTREAASPEGILAAFVQVRSRAADSPIEPPSRTVQLDASAVRTRAAFGIEGVQVTNVILATGSARRAIDNALDRRIGPYHAEPISHLTVRSEVLV